MLQLGKEYLYTYPTINLFINGQVSSWTIELKAILPEGIIYEDSNDYYVLKICKIYSITDNNEINNIENPYVRCSVPPKIKGKNKWLLKEEKNTQVSIIDLPDILFSSLNSYEHPSKRNWFIHKNLGFSESNYTKVDWKNWNKYCLGFQFTDFHLYYYLLCKILLFEVGNGDIKLSDFNEWNGYIKYQIKYDSKYKISEDVLDDFSESFMRDFLKLW
ncbi:hypothetical protein [Flavobacterium sp.]|uniref:hypothetical protein n=1 Tax=Flavobacterium sp. TaxID=239 RepID=UPI00404752ED